MTFANPDFQALFDFLLGMAKKLLEKQSTFLLFAAFVPPDRKKVALVSVNTTDAQPGSQKVLALLEPSLRKMADKGTCRAVGLAMDTRLKAAPRKDAIGRDAIWIRIESKDGTAIMAATPYSKNWLHSAHQGPVFQATAEELRD